MSLEPAALLIGLREGLEALLILGILLGLLSRLGHSERRGWVFGGAAVGLAASLLLGYALHGLTETAGERAQETFELVAGLAAVVILTYMVIWMYRHTQQILGTLKQKVQAAASQGQWIVIGTLAFVAVAREGVETVLFYASLSSRTAWTDLLLAGLVGFGLSALVALALFRFTVRLDLKKFFGVTGILLVFITAGLVAATVHEAEELGWVPEREALWDTSGTLPDKGHWLGGPLHALVGYQDNPTVLQLAFYLAYLLGVGGWYLAALGRRGPVADRQPAPEGGLV